MHVSFCPGGRGGEVVSVLYHFLFGHLVPCSIQGISVLGPMFRPGGPCLVGICHRDNPPVHLMVATAAGGMHPTGVHSCL